VLFRSPVRVGDNLNIKAVVVAKHEREQTIDLDIVADVSGRGPVLRGRGTVMVLNLEDQDNGTKPIKPVRRALITGATGAIGSAIARSLSADGFHVIVHSNRNLKNARVLQEELSKDGNICDVFQCDLLNVENLKKFSQDLLGRFGIIDTLVLNASTAIDDTDLLKTQIARVNESITMNLFSSLSLIQDFMPGMKKQNWGRIIGVSSDVVHVQPTKGWFSYTVGKTALEALLRQSAIEFGLFGITSNLVAPGMTDTNFVSNIPPRMRQVIAQTTPTRRLANPTDISSAVSYLCQSSSGHLNGQTIRINGGIGV